MRTITVLLPDGIEDVLNGERAIEGRDAKPVDDDACSQFVRGLFYAYLRDVGRAGIGPADYAARFMEVNRVRG